MCRPPQPVHPVLHPIDDGAAIDREGIRYFCGAAVVLMTMVLSIVLLCLK